MTTLDKPIFRDLAADDKDQEITEITSVCMNCYEDVSFSYKINSQGPIIYLTNCF